MPWLWYWKKNIIEYHIEQGKEVIRFALPNEPLFCGHLDAHETRFVCEHLASQTPENNYYQWFTGRAQEYFLVCEQCAKVLKAGEATIQLRPICLRCYKEREEDGYWTGISGRPEVLVRAPAFSLIQQRIPLPLSTPLLALQPIDAEAESTWIAFTAEGDLVRLNLTTQNITHLVHLPPSQLDMTKPVSLHLAPDGQMAAIVNTKGQHGVVVDLRTGKITLFLTRDTYHIEHMQFPITFFACEGRLLLVHGTKWNRLDISDPHTGELISKRPTPQYKRGQPQTEHYLDYFHAGLSVSPGQEWIADNGWVWHPVGVVTTWNLRRWVQENVWESEDGPSYHELCRREYYWDGPLCWVDERTLAIWGYGDDDLWLIPAVRLFDVHTGKETGWFAGPEKGMLVFDEYLFACSPEHGLSVWNVTTGERVGYFPAFRPTHYHRGIRQFLALDALDGVAIVGTLHAVQKG